jgi:5-methyltetrahydrofolate--homocysteine methyltransferase
MRIAEIYQAVLALDEAQVAELTATELAQGTPPADILNDGLIAAMEEVGRRFSSGDLFLPEMLIAAQAMKAAVEVLRPELARHAVASRGRVLIGTVKGDVHDIGKNLVVMMLEGAGFEVFDLGVDVSTASFLHEVSEKRPDVVALSALLTTTMPAMETVVSELKQAHQEVKVIVGGAPVTASFAQHIGADGYSIDAPEAVHTVRQLLQNRVAE